MKIRPRFVMTKIPLVVNILSMCIALRHGEECNGDAQEYEHADHDERQRHQQHRVLRRLLLGRIRI